MSSHIGVGFSHHSSFGVVLSSVSMSGNVLVSPPRGEVFRFVLLPKGCRAKS
ncbi:MAG TPA: hypothetical protein VHA06_04330 [Candidatus Angelobacter sp.]|nr:hypothetical protein [Candidatus Angelobacter sp.]